MILLIEGKDCCKILEKSIAKIELLGWHVIRIISGKVDPDKKNADKKLLSPLPSFYRLYGHNCDSMFFNFIHFLVQQIHFPNIQLPQLTPTKPIKARNTPRRWLRRKGLNLTASQVWIPSKPNIAMENHGCLAAVGFFLLIHQVILENQGQK